MRHFVSLLAVAMIATSCSNNPPPVTTAPSAPVTLYLTGVLEVQGTNVVSFTGARTGPANVTLVSVTTDPRGAASGVVLDMGFGTSADGVCTITMSIQAAAGLSAQLIGSVTSGSTYCVMLTDVGNLTGPVNFVVRVVQP